MEGTVTISLKDYKELSIKSSMIDDIKKTFQEMCAVTIPGTSLHVDEIPEIREIISKSNAK